LTHIFFFCADLGLLLFVPAGVTLFLGFWQVRRRGWKLGLIKEREDAVRLPAHDVTRVYSADDWAKLAFRRVRARGCYLPELSVLVSPRFPLGVAGQPGGPSRDGAHVITPFVLLPAAAGATTADGGDGQDEEEDSDAARALAAAIAAAKGSPRAQAELARDHDIVIVNRGWAPRTMLAERDLPDAVETPAGLVTIRGVARAEVDPGTYGPRNAAAAGAAGSESGPGACWSYVDAMSMAESVGLNPTAMVVDLAEHRDARAPGAKYPLPAQTPIELRNTHLEYALTWFTLCGAVTVAAVVRLRG
jgi:cytochrome oxidase assembly protein ShyY1